MKDFARIHTAWMEADGAITEGRNRARSQAGRDQWDRLQELNDSAYFVLLFAQFEDRVNGLALRVIRSRQRRPGWPARRLWDTMPSNLDDLRKVAFRDRVALLTDRSRHHFRDITAYYDIRNRIAHGDTSISGIIIPTVVQDLRRLARMLRA